MKDLPMIYLKMGTGQILPDCRAGAIESGLWLYFKNMTISEVAEIVLNHDATNKIEFHYGKTHDSYEGYTKVKAINDHGDIIEVKMVGGFVSEEVVRDERNLAGDGSAGLPDDKGSATGDIHSERETE